MSQFLTHSRLYNKSIIYTEILTVPPQLSLGTQKKLPKETASTIVNHVSLTLYSAEAFKTRSSLILMKLIF